MEGRWKGRARAQGFTLQELMITLAIGMAVTTSAVPALSSVLTGNRMHSGIQSFHSHLLLTRNEAIRRGTRVTMCPSADGDTCLRKPTWEAGWIVFADENGDREHQSAEPLLAVRAALHPTLTLTSSIYRRRIIYQPSGSAGGSNGTFTLCDLGKNVPPKAIIISPFGRPRVSDTRWDGRPLSCT